MAENPAELWDSIVTSPYYWELDEDKRESVALNFDKKFNADLGKTYLRSLNADEGDFKGGVNKGLHQTAGLIGGAIGLAGDAVGSDSVRDWGFNKYQEQEEQAALHGGDVQRIEDINGFGDAVDWFQGMVGTQLPTIATIALGGGIPGAVAKKVLTKAAEEAVAVQVAKGVAKEVAEKQVAAGISKVGQKFTEAGVAASSGAIEAGGMWGEDAAQHGVENANAGSAAVLGGLSGASEIFSPVQRAAAGLGLPSIGRAATDGIKTRLTKGIIGTGMQEAGQEIGQGALSISNDIYTSPEKDLSYFASDESKSELLNSGAAGFVLGGLGGGVSSAFPNKKPQEPPPEDKPVTPPADILAAQDIDTAIQSFTNSVGIVGSEIAERQAFTTPQEPLAPEFIPLDDAEAMQFGREAAQFTRDANLQGQQAAAAAQDNANRAAWTGKKPARTEYTNNQEYIVGAYEPLLPGEAKPVVRDYANLPEETQAIMPAIDKMAAEIAGGQVSRSFQNEDGETSPTVSSYPDWFKQRTVNAYNKKIKQNISLTKNNVNYVIERVREGKPLRGRQHAIFEYLKDVAINKQGKDPEVMAQDKFYELSDEGFQFEKPEKVAVGDLNKGDEVVIMGDNGVPDKLTHKGRDAETGEIIFQDGVKMFVDEFDQLEVIAQRKAKQAQQQNPELNPEGAQIGTDEIAPGNTNGLKDIPKPQFQNVEEIQGSSSNNEDLEFRNVDSGDNTSQGAAEGNMRDSDGVNSPAETQQSTSLADESPVSAGATAPVSFKTAKGSTYTFEGQQTVRDKAKRPEHGEDFGVKEKSDVTFFIPVDAAREIGAWNTSNATGKRIVVRGDTIILTSMNDITGKRGSDGRFQYKTTPEIGLSPVELWKKDKDGYYKGNHPGNQIISISPQQTTTNKEQQSLTPPPHDNTANVTVQKDGKSPEQLMREAWGENNPITLGEWHPVTVTHNGKTHRFLGKQKAIAKGKNQAVIHLIRIKKGKLLSNLPETDIIEHYKLDGGNRFIDIGTPSEADKDAIAEWNKNFPTPAESTATPTTAKVQAEAVVSPDKPIEWTKPTRKQLEDEWYTETLDTMFFAGYPKKGQSEKYRDHFIENIDKFSTVETITAEDLPRQLYVTDTVENLAENIKHMDKDVPGIDLLLKEGKPAMPLVIRKDGKLKILGGRTRTSLSIMAGKEVKAIVIDEEKMRESFYPFRKEEFLKDGYAFFTLESKETRQEIINYLEGKRDTLPPFEKFEHKKKDVDALAKHLGIKPPANIKQAPTDTDKVTDTVTKQAPAYTPAELSSITGITFSPGFLDEAKPPNAKEALEMIDEDIKIYKQLMDCVSK